MYKRSYLKKFAAFELNVMIKLNATSTLKYICNLENDKIFYVKTVLICCDDN